MGELNIFILFRILQFVLILDLQSSLFFKYVSALSSGCDSVELPLGSLRDLMANLSIQAYIIPMGDAHQNEYVADCDKRIQFISKFTGSSGEAVVTLSKAALWTDSRYYLQAEEQLDLNCWELMKSGNSSTPNKLDWLVDNLSKNSTVGVDPFLMTTKEFRQIRTKLMANGHDLVDVSANLVDIIWTTRPLRRSKDIYPLKIEFSGKACNLKVLEILNEMNRNNAEYLIITKMDEIAWLTNLRGSDIEYNPLFFSYAILGREKLHLFVNTSQLTSDAREQMIKEDLNFTVHNYDDFIGELQKLMNSSTGNVLTSPTVSEAIAKNIPDERRYELNIISNIKYIKNSVEAQNMELAHIRDGLALIKYLHWLNETIDSGTVTELSGAAQLKMFRENQKNYKGLSFEAISAFGDHAASAHYSPTISTNRKITRNAMYLIDSGGHYWDGTTDVTRTIHFGSPTREEKLCYTLVLKGFIAVTTSVFPKTTTVNFIDNIARRPLWQYGLNYGHGTGHGVGMFLSVHEYPPLLSSRSSETLQENVFLSNEPAFYKDGDFGIRIEDVIQVIKSNIPHAFSDEGGLTFKSITYAPLDTKLILPDLLTNEETSFVNTYNRRVMDTIGPILLKHREMGTYLWLLDATRNII